MAKRKKAKATRRRRRVGAVALNAKSPLVMYGSMVGGFLLAGQINPIIDKVTGTMDAKIVGAATGGIGAALVFAKLGKKKTTVEVVTGGLLLGAGVKRLATAFGIMNGIGGYQSVPVIGRSRMNGYGKVPVIAGYSPGPSALNGAFSGYQVPMPPHTQVMGSASGNGYSNGGSGYME